MSTTPPPHRPAPAAKATSPQGGEAREIVMPDLEGAEEITIGAWSKRKGDHVDEGQTLLEALTDKANAHIPSPDSGALEELLPSEGGPVKTRQPTPTMHP